MGDDHRSSLSMTTTNTIQTITFQPNLVHFDGRINRFVQYCHRRSKL